MGAPRKQIGNGNNGCMGEGLNPVEWTEFIAAFTELVFP